MGFAHGRCSALDVEPLSNLGLPVSPCCLFWSWVPYKSYPVPQREQNCRLSDTQPQPPPSPTTSEADPWLPKPVHEALSEDVTILMATIMPWTRRLMWQSADQDLEHSTVDFVSPVQQGMSYNCIPEILHSAERRATAADTSVG